MSAEQEWIDWIRKLEDPSIAIREFAIQYHYFSVHQIVAFSRAVASLSPTDRIALSTVASVMVDELGSPQKNNAHSIIFERFAISAGVPATELPAQSSRAHPDVRAYVRALDYAFSSGSQANVLGAYQFLEASAVSTYAPLLSLFESLQLPNLDLTFFKLHAELEPQHLAAAEHLAQALDEPQRKLMRWQQDRLAARWDSFWRGIHAASVKAVLQQSVSQESAWRSDPVFLRLCDIVASDRLVCLTGAGVSSGLPRASSATLLPSWPQLVRELRDVLAPFMLKEQLRDVDDILDCVWPSGRLLIEAASLLRRANPEKFEQTLIAAVTPQDGATSDTHRAICELSPRGIFTFNYDNAHETAASEKGFHYQILQPHESEDQGIVAALAAGLNKPFLLKAHGSIKDRAENLVLTSESYRELMARQPAYRALVQHILTEFHLVIIGFGLSDPDFDLLVDTLVDSYGASVRDSVVIRHRREETAAEILLRRRYGIKTLYVDSFADIPKVLRDARVWAGPHLTAALEHALSPGSTSERSGAHVALRQLGRSGRASASATLRRELSQVSSDPQNDFRTSELIYSLGVVTERMNEPDERNGREDNKQAIKQLVDDSTSADPIARALTVLRPLLNPDDLSDIERWQRRFQAAPFDEPRFSRLVVYADYLRIYIAAKFDSEPKLAAPQ